MYRSSIVVSILPTSTGTCTVGTSYLLLHRCIDTRYGMSLEGGGGALSFIIPCTVAVQYNITKLFTEST